MNGSYSYSSMVLRALIRQYTHDLEEAQDSNDVYYVRICEQKLKRFHEELPEVELMEKLESGLDA